jgi:hypothetical protein
MTNIYKQSFDKNISSVYFLYYIFSISNIKILITSGYKTKYQVYLCNLYNLYN